MRFVLALLALSIATVGARPDGTDDEGGAAPAPQPAPPAPGVVNADHLADAQQRLDAEHPLISSGKFNTQRATTDIVNGVGNSDGKSTYLSPEELAAGTNRGTHEIKDLHVTRPQAIRDAGLHPVADAGNRPAAGDYVAPEGHVHLTTPPGQQMTSEQVTAALGRVQDSSVKAKDHAAAQELLAEAAKDHTKPMKEVDAAIKARKAAEAAEAKKAAKAAKQAAKKNNQDPPADGGAAGGAPPATVCKRDGSFCLIGNRPKSAALKSTPDSKSSTSRGITTKGTKPKTASGLKAVKGNRKVGKQTGTKAVRKSAGKAGKGLKATKGTKGRTAKAVKGVKGRKATKGAKNSRASKAVKGAKNAKARKGTKSLKTAKGAKAPKGAKGLKGTKSLKGNAKKGTKSLRSPKAAKGAKAVKGAKASKSLKTKGAKSLKTKAAKATKGTKSLRSPKAVKSTKPKAVKGTKAKAVKGTKANKATKFTKANAVKGTKASKAVKQTKTATKANAGRKQAAAPAAAPRRAAAVKAAAPKAKVAAAAAPKKAGKKYIRRDTW